jgi:hypothetical protein
MNGRRTIAAVRSFAPVGLLLLSACGAEHGGQEEQMRSEPAIVRGAPSEPLVPIMPPGAVGMSVAVEGRKPVAGASEGLSESRRIRREHRLHVEVPALSLDSVVRARAHACLAPTCQIETMEIEAGGTGTLSMRVERTGIGDALDAVRADGRVRSEATSAADLSNQWIDVDRRLAAKKALRDRLQLMTAERPQATVSELLELQRELSSVQGDIEAAEAKMRSMDLQTSMDLIQVNYTSTLQPISRSMFEPLDDALRGWLNDLIATVAAVVALSARVIPWVLVGLLGLHLIIRASTAAWAPGRRRRDAP